jgi:hypothetical protein
VVVPLYLLPRTCILCTMITVFVRLLHPCFVFLLITQNKIQYNKLHLKDEDVQVWCLKTEIKGIAQMQAIDIFTEDVQVWCLKTDKRYCSNAGY